MGPTALPSNIAVITAALDLKLVRLLRDAIHSTSITELGDKNLVIEQRRTITPEPRIEPRQTITPDPRIEPRQTITPDPRIEPAEIYRCEPFPHPCGNVERNSPIQPPWAVLPWETPIPVEIPPPPRIKVHRYRPDIAYRGTMIDFIC